MIQCSDNSSYLGDILIGADGAYSAVRQSLYRQLNEKKELPFKDTQGLKIGYMTMVGTTEPLEEDAYEELKDDFTRFNFVIGKGKPYTVSFSFLFLFVCLCCRCASNAGIAVAEEGVNKRIKVSHTHLPFHLTSSSPQNLSVEHIHRSRQENLLGRPDAALLRRGRRHGLQEHRMGS